MDTINFEKFRELEDGYIDYNELNRIESACLNYYKLFERQHITVERLSFTLGNYGGIKI